jgi:hypothetical protein
MIKKVNYADIPSTKISDLEALIPNKKVEYIVIGKNFYELHPTPSVKLLESISLLFDMIDNAKVVKIKKSKESGIEISNDDVQLTYADLFVIDENRRIFKEILSIILEGVDEDDFNEMTLPQMYDVISKVISVNMDALPFFFKQQFSGVVNTSSTIDNIANENLDTKKKI